MPSIDRPPLPDGALLQACKRAGEYTDCFAIDVPGAITIEQYIAAFYTTWVFRLERLILLLIWKPSTDAQAKQLAAGKRTNFAAWRVEERTRYQILLTDFRGKTRSWLLAKQMDGGARTRLFFGSAVVPKGHTKSGQPKLGFVSRGLLGLHLFYSRVLLRAAARRLRR
jgi:hypothetical protein